MIKPSISCLMTSEGWGRAYRDGQSATSVLQGPAGGLVMPGGTGIGADGIAETEHARCRHDPLLHRSEIEQ
jgi:hypothetical protein